MNRIDELRCQGLQQFKGPFLAGKAFTAVDAFYAPVVFRAQTFNLPFSQKAQDYMQLILLTPISNFTIETTQDYNNNVSLEAPV